MPASPASTLGPTGNMTWYYRYIYSVQRERVGFGSPNQSSWVSLSALMASSGWSGARLASCAGLGWLSLVGRGWLAVLGWQPGLDCTVLGLAGMSQPRLAGWAGRHNSFPSDFSAILQISVFSFRFRCLCSHFHTQTLIHVFYRK